MLKRTVMLALLGLSLVSAKKYTFTIPDPAQIGNTQLSRGEYAIKLDGSNAVLMDAQGRAIDAKAAVEVAGDKFQQTAVGMDTDASGTVRIRWIQLGGTRNKVVFEDTRDLAVQ